MRCRLWSVGIIGQLAAIGCFLPEVTVDDELTLPLGAMDPRATPSGLTGDAGDDAEKETACSNYCARFMRLCASHPAATYSDERDCEETCLISGGWPLGDSNAPNSIRCREYHSILAEMDAATHCYHAAETPSRGFCEKVVVAPP
jgi:hypothetical protein